MGGFFRKFYFCNAMTQVDETRVYSLEEHTKALEKHGAIVDGVIFSKDFIPKEILEFYKKVGSEPAVIKENNHNYELIKANLLCFEHNLIK